MTLVRLKINENDKLHKNRYRSRSLYQSGWDPAGQTRGPDPDIFLSSI